MTSDIYMTMEDNTSDQSLLHHDTSIFSDAHSNDGSISIRHYGKDYEGFREEALARVAQSIQDELAPAFYRESTKGGPFGTNTSIPPPVPYRPPCSKKARTCVDKEWRRSPKEFNNYLIKTLVITCAVLVLCLLGMIILAFKFNLDYISCRDSNQQPRDCSEKIDNMTDPDATSEKVKQSSTTASTTVTTGRVETSKRNLVTEINCCCDMCRDMMTTVYLDKVSEHQINPSGVTTSLNDNYARTRENPTDVCVFGSACARVGIRIPDEIKLCATLDEYHFVNLNDSMENRQRQNRKGISVHNNAALDIKTTGVYMVHSRLAYNPNCSALCSSSNKKKFVHQVRVYRVVDRNEPSKDENFDILTEQNICCNDCRNHPGISYVRGIFKLLKNDDVFIKTTGPDLINYTHASSFFEVVLLKEGDDDN